MKIMSTEVNIINNVINNDRGSYYRHLNRYCICLKNDIIYISTSVVIILI